MRSGPLILRLVSLSMPKEVLGSIVALCSYKSGARQQNNLKTHMLRYSLPKYRLIIQKIFLARIFSLNCQLFVMLTCPENK